MKNKRTILGLDTKIKSVCQFNGFCIYANFTVCCFSFLLFTLASMLFDIFYVFFHFLWREKRAFIEDKDFTY